LLGECCEEVLCNTYRYFYCNTELELYGSSQNSSVRVKICCGNWDSAGFGELIKMFPDGLLKKFHVSGNVGVLFSDPEFFTKIFEEDGIKDPNSRYFVDDEVHLDAEGAD